MCEDLEIRADSIGVWHDGELPASSLCTKCLEFHGIYAPCIPSPLPVKSGITGSLSLHDYRKCLSLSAGFVDGPADRSEKTLKRKTAKLNLNRPPPLSSLPSCTVSVSSAASTPPPLSPSYSHSIVSQRSEQEPEFPPPPIVPPSQDSPGHLVSENAIGPRPNRKRLNTFREKLRKKTQGRDQAQNSTPSHSHKSDPMLDDRQAVATISHEGASFEILNPRKSLDLARIVSFIEDVDGCSLLSMDPHRDSNISCKTYSLDQGVDRASLSQFTDASLPSHYSRHSLYSTPKRHTSDLPSSSPGVHDRVRSLSEYSLHEHNYWTSTRQDHTEQHEDQLYYHQLVAESPHQRMGSISERLEETEEPHDEHRNPQSQSQSPRPPSSSQPTFHSEESEIGEPGSPVYANGEWALVHERDRGILLDLPSPSSSPYDTYFANTMSNSPHHDPYDPIYFDPHVQSVLAAANAETMGLRGHPARALDEFQRKHHGSGDGVRSNSDGRKPSFSQRKKLRRLFSWRSWN